MAFAGSGVFYGSGSFYLGVGSSPVDGIPQDLRFYRTSQDGIYVFWWGFNPAFITPSLASANFDLELDTSNTFTSPNLVSFTSGSLVDPPITFQNGNVRKGFAVPVATRVDGIVQTWYARVRTHTFSYISDWSSTLTWTIPQKTQQQYAESLMTSLPDAHVYGKGDLLKPVNQRNSNLYLVDNMYGNQLDQVYYANYLTQTDNYITLCVDENLYQNFGVLFNYAKPNSMQYVDYRWILMNLIQASLVGSTNEAIILTVQSFTGVPPIITNIRDEDDFFLITIQDPTVVAIVSVPVHTSYPFTDATFVLENITTGLLVPSSSYTTDGVQGTWTLTNGALSGHTFQAMFDTGNPSDPFPVVFDALAGATTLTGLVTFTNGSMNVTGGGTLFLTELSIGDEITDPNGIYIGEVSQITDNTHATLLNPWFGPTEVTASYILLYTDLQLPPPILWDESTLAFGVLITILNPGNFALV